jgi:hypothetical protein
MTKHLLLALILLGLLALAAGVEMLPGETYPIPICQRYGGC